MTSLFALYSLSLSAFSWTLLDPKDSCYAPNRFSIYWIKFSAVPPYVADLCDDKAPTFLSIYKI
jgi:hypothetical protein